MPSIKTTIQGLFLLLRPKQWIKNGFVFAPLLFSGLFLNSNEMIHALDAFLFFCIASSAVYIVNDIYDMPSDRLHPQKSKTRPLASGIISVSMALILLSFLYALLILGWFFMPKVICTIMIYIVLNITYTFVLKHQPVLDIFSISIGFVLRVYAGAVALNVPVSGWMFITTLCLALYLAAVKRRQELNHYKGTTGRTVLNKYSVSLLDRYAELSATGALMFYSMFVMSAKPQLLITIPLVLFGLFRYWYVVEQSNEGESPTDVLLADRQLLLVVTLWVGVCSWILWP